MSEERAEQVTQSDTLLSAVVASSTTEPARSGSANVENELLEQSDQVTTVFPVEEAPEEYEEIPSSRRTPSLNTLKNDHSKRSSRILTLRESMDKSGVLRGIRERRATHACATLTAERCATHGERQNVVCLEPCRCKICYECGLFGQHKGHKMIPESEFLQELEDLQQQVQSLAAKMDGQELLFREKFGEQQLQQRFSTAFDRLLLHLETRGREVQEAIAIELRRCQSELRKHFAEIETALSKRVTNKAGLETRLQEWRRGVAALLNSPASAREFKENLITFQNSSWWQLVQTGQALLSQMALRLADTEHGLTRTLGGCQVVVRPLPKELFFLRKADQLDPTAELDNLLTSDYSRARPSAPEGPEDVRLVSRFQDTRLSPVGRNARQSGRFTPLVNRQRISDVSARNFATQSPMRDLRLPLFKTEGGEEAETDARSKTYSQEWEAPRQSSSANSHLRLRTPKASNRRLPTPKDNLFYPQSPESADWQASSAQTENKSYARLTPKKTRPERKSATGTVPPNVRAAFDKGNAAALKRLLCGRHAPAVRNLQRDRLLALDLTDGGLSDQDLAALAELIVAAKGLRTLKLARNKITNDGLAYMSAAVLNSTLTSLDLAGNSITADGLPFLQRLLAGNRALKVVSLKRNLVNTQAARSLIAELKARLRSLEV